MSVNFTIIIIVLAFYIFINFLPIQRKNKDLFFLVATFSLLYVILYIRKPISDAESYFEYFKYFNTVQVEEFWQFLNIEPGYRVLNFLIGRFTSDPTVFLHIIDLLSLIGIFFCIKKYSDNYLISALLYVSLGTFSMCFFILRQAIAISILAFAVKYIQERKFVKFLLLVLLATSFHKSSAIFVIAYFLCNIKVTKLYTIIISVGGVLTLLFKEAIVQVAAPILADKGYTSMVSGGGYGKLISLIVLVVSLLAVSQYLKGKNETRLSLRPKDNTTDVYVVLSYVIIIIQILATQQGILTRMTGSFMIGLELLGSNIISVVNNERIRTFLKIGLIAACIIYAIMAPSIQGYIINI